MSANNNRAVYRTSINFQQEKKKSDIEALQGIWGKEGGSNQARDTEDVRKLAKSRTDSPAPSPNPLDKSRSASAVNKPNTQEQTTKNAAILLRTTDPGSSTNAPSSNPLPRRGGGSSSTSNLVNVKKPNTGSPMRQNSNNQLERNPSEENKNSAPVTPPTTSFGNRAAAQASPGNNAKTKPELQEIKNSQPGSTASPPQSPSSPATTPSSSVSSRRALFTNSTSGNSLAGKEAGGVANTKVGPIPLQENKPTSSANVKQSLYVNALIDNIDPTPKGYSAGIQNSPAKQTSMSSNLIQQQMQQFNQNQSPPPFNGNKPGAPVVPIRSKSIDQNPTPNTSSSSSSNIQQQMQAFNQSPSGTSSNPNSRKGSAASSPLKPHSSSGNGMAASPVQSKRLSQSFTQSPPPGSGSPQTSGSSLANKPTTSGSGNATAPSTPVKLRAVPDSHTPDNTAGAPTSSGIQQQMQAFKQTPSPSNSQTSVSLTNNKSNPTGPSAGKAPVTPLKLRAAPDPSTPERPSDAKMPSTLQQQIQAFNQSSLSAAAAAAPVGGTNNKSATSSPVKLKKTPSQSHINYEKNPSPSPTSRIPGPPPPPPSQNASPTPKVMSSNSPASGKHQSTPTASSGSNGANGLNGDQITTSPVAQSAFSTRASSFASNPVIRARRKSATPAMQSMITTKLSADLEASPRAPAVPPRQSPPTSPVLNKQQFAATAESADVKLFMKVASLGSVTRNKANTTSAVPNPTEESASNNYNFHGSVDVNDSDSKHVVAGNFAKGRRMSRTILPSKIPRNEIEEEIEAKTLPLRSVVSDLGDEMSSGDEDVSSSSSSVSSNPSPRAGFSAPRKLSASPRSNSTTNLFGSSSPRSVPSNVSPRTPSSNNLNSNPSPRSLSTPTMLASPPRPERPKRQNAHLVVLQSFIRMVFKRRAYLLKLKKQKKKKKIIEELLTTEEDYLSNLHLCLSVFLVPLTKEVPKHMLGEELLRSLHAILADLQAIVGFHEFFLSELRPKVKCFNWHSTFGSMFLELFAYMKSYGQYVSHYQDCLPILASKRKNDSVFNDFLNMFKTEQCKGKGISDFLIMPIQRVPRYKMLVADLAKNTTDDHADYALLNKATVQLGDIAEQLDEVGERSARTAKLMEMSMYFTYPKGEEITLVAPHRLFLMEAAGLVKYKDFDKACQMWIFNDMIFFAKKSKKLTNVDNKAKIIKTFFLEGLQATANYDGNKPKIVIDSDDGTCHLYLDAGMHDSVLACLVSIQSNSSTAKEKSSSASKAIHIKQPSQRNTQEVQSDKKNKMKSTKKKSNSINPKNPLQFNDNEDDQIGSTGKSTRMKLERSKSSERYTDGAFRSTSNEIEGLGLPQLEGMDPVRSRSPSPPVSPHGQSGMQQAAASSSLTSTSNVPRPSMRVAMSERVAASNPPPPLDHARKRKSFRIEIKGLLGKKDKKPEENVSSNPPDVGDGSKYSVDSLISPRNNESSSVEQIIEGSQTARSDSRGKFARKQPNWAKAEGERYGRFDRTADTEKPVLTSSASIVEYSNSSNSGEEGVTVSAPVPANRTLSRSKSMGECNMKKLVSHHNAPSTSASVSDSGDSNDASGSTGGEVSEEESTKTKMAGHRNSLIIDRKK